MSSTVSEIAPARPARWRALLALFGVAMFVLGVGIGGLALPRLLALNPAVTPQASVVAQAPLATATIGATVTLVTTPTVAATVVPPTVPATATAPPPTASVAPTATTGLPTATLPGPTATATLAPTPTMASTSPPSSIFAPDPQGTVTAAPTIVIGTPTSRATATATTTAEVTATPPATPTPSPVTPAFAATDRVNTEVPVNFRAGPGTTYAAQTALPPGTLLAATGEAATVDGVAWRQFSIANGTVGWVRAQDVLAVR